ncbi:hypothetical protein T484DRAFT_1834133 [Baffinella frigidus]|nr:hypothetical protein T484DRAFT_1834133 [Cryptophyta sp. CCMP2293]
MDQTSYVAWQSIVVAAFRRAATAVALASLLLLLLPPLFLAARVQRCAPGTHGSAADFVAEGAAAFGENALQDAAACFQAAADFVPTPPPHISSVALSNLGTVLNMLGDRAAALKAFRRAVAADPKDSESVVQLGKLLIALGEGEEGVVHLRKALKQNPAHPQGNFALAIEEQKLGDNSKAMELCKRALKADPSYAAARVQLAILYSLQKQCDKAHEEARRAKTLPGVTDNMLAGLARSMRLCGDLEDNMLAGLARSMRLCGDLEGARIMHAAAAKLNPGAQLGVGRDTRTHEHALGATLLELGRYERAIASLRKAVKLGDVHTVSVHSMIGFAFTQLGGGANLTRAMKHLGLACESAGLLVATGDTAVGRSNEKASDEEAWHGESALGNLARVSFMLASWNRTPAILKALEEHTKSALLAGRDSPSNPIAIATARKVASNVSTDPNNVSTDAQDVSKSENTQRFADETLASGPVRVGFVSGDISGKNGVGRHLSDWTFWKRCKRSRWMECVILCTDPAASATATEQLVALQSTLDPAALLMLPGVNKEADRTATLAAGLHARERTPKPDGRS